MALLHILFPGHLWLTRKDICGEATKVSNSQVHFAGKEIVTKIKFHDLENSVVHDVELRNQCLLLYWC